MNQRQQIRIWLKPVINLWFNKQCEQLDDLFYLWFNPTSKKGDEALIIAKEAPNTSWERVSDTVISKTWCKLEVMKICMEWCVSLPLFKF